MKHEISHLEMRNPRPAIPGAPIPPVIITLMSGLTVRGTFGLDWRPRYGDTLVITDSNDETSEFEVIVMTAVPGPMHIEIVAREIQAIHQLDDLNSPPMPPFGPFIQSIPVREDL